MLPSPGNVMISHVTILNIKNYCGTLVIKTGKITSLKILKSLRSIKINHSMKLGNLSFHIINNHGSQSDNLC